MPGGISRTGRNPLGFRPVLLWMLALSAVGFGGCTPRPSAPSYPVESIFLIGDDGARVAAAFYPVPNAAPPGLILIHGMHGHRNDWDRFARAAQRAGIASLAFDLRGHGDTVEDGRGRSLEPPSLTRDDWRLIPADIEAAWRALAARGINPGEVGIIGASVGANLGLQFAAVHEDIQAVLLVSPGLTREGIAIEEAMEAYRQRPALIMVGAHDAYAASSGRALAAVSPGHFDLREYSNAAHGTDLFELSDQALEQAIYWLASTLRGAILTDSTPVSAPIP